MLRVKEIDRAWLGALLVGMLTLLCWLGPRPAQAGTTVPHFVLPLVTDGVLTDSDDYKGKVRLITFWATWCPPCREEIPALIRLQDEFGAKGFTVVALSVDQDSSGMLKKFVAKNKINYPVMRADQDVLQKFGGVNGVPYSFLVDQAGNVVKSYPGFADHRILQNDIKGLLR